jgi:hypothetical protein
MKKILFIVLLVISRFYFIAFSQEVNNYKFNPDQQTFFTPKNHDPNFLKSGKLSDKSFYQRKSEWQHIIDSTWGPGAPLNEKLSVFNNYAREIRGHCDALSTLNLNWDSLYNHYLNQITASTSKGAFSSIMSHFAYAFKDVHTFAYDSDIASTPLNPGVPVLLLGSLNTIEHFGAVTTVLPDSTTLVLRVAPNHPLNLEPGDIILGYEGIPWKNLARELLNAGLPMMAHTGGCKSANTYHNLFGAGLNWHLFNTIDILKYSSGNILHLSVLPLVNFNIPPMANNEQLPIQNINFPNAIPDPVSIPDTVVTYGILENTNIGYIFLKAESADPTPDEQLFKAINDLKNTDALIIDMRTNYGGWLGTIFDKAFNILFNEYHKTVDHVVRCDTNTFNLCPYGDWNELQINGKDPDYYDRPIAVLLGPTCISMGDITAQRLRYHPMVRFFGASSVACLGVMNQVDSPGWILYLSFADVYHTSEPGVYLNRREFPVDYPVWFNKDDVAKGKDPIVAKSLEWINNLVYGHSVITDKMAYSAGSDTIRVDAIIENPNMHAVSAKLIFESLDGSFTDSIDMSKLNPAEGNKWRGKWIAPPPPNYNTYWVSIKATDNTAGTYFTNKHVTRITTIPLVINSLSYASIAGSKYRIRPFLKNEGITQKITKIMVNLESTDPWITLFNPAKSACPDLLPDQAIETYLPFEVSYNPSTFPYYFNLKFTISTDGWPYWVIDTTIKIYTGIDDEGLIPLTNNLDQNYPNPFNPTTTISWQLAHECKATLSIFDLTGREVAILVDEQRSPGKYETRFNAENLPKGVYFYQLRARNQVITHKLIKM